MHCLSDSWKIAEGTHRYFSTKCLEGSPEKTLYESSAEFLEKSQQECLKEFLGKFLDKFLENLTEYLQEEVLEKPLRKFQDLFLKEFLYKFLEKVPQEYQQACLGESKKEFLKEF